MRPWLTLLLLVHTMGLAACGKGSDSADAEPLPAGGPSSGATAGGSFNLEYTTDPSPIPLSEPFTMRTQVSDRDGRWLDDVTVVINAEMPAHGHGMNTSTSTTFDVDGWYDTEGMLFHMPGDWQIVIDVASEDTVETARLAYRCCATE